MKIQHINSFKDKFLGHIVNSGIDVYLHKYDAHKHFIDNWDLSALKLEYMFDQSFRSDISGRLWGGSVNSPKSMMMSFIETNREFVRSMFRDLEDENKDISMRVSRFLLHCDEMLLQLQRAGKKINDHFHDRQIISLYLCFMYPGKYTIYNYDDFRISMRKFEARNMPQEFDIEKFFILSGTVFRILSKDEALMSFYNSALKKEGLVFDDSSMLLISDFYEFVAGT